MLATDKLPPAVNDARCRHCSLKDSCLPEVIGETLRWGELQAALFCDD
jgi:CRISPR-associated exonuclease Cas4